MPFPFLFLVLSLTSGILLSSLFSFSLRTAVFSLISCLALAWFFYKIKKNKFCFLFILLATLFLGCGLYSFHHQRYEKNSLHNWKQNAYADFYGRLYRSVSRGLDRDFLYLKVEKIFYRNKEEKIRGNLRLSIPHSTEFHVPLDLFRGDQIKVSAQTLSFHEYRNFQEPFLKKYLKTQQIHSLALTKSPLLVQKLKEGKKLSLMHLISVLRQKLQNKIEQYFPSSETKPISSEGAVLETLILGERARMEPETTSSLQKTGLYHLFAISGAHIGIISYLVFSLFKLIRVPSRLSYLILIVLLVFYSLLVEGRASVFRATIMTIVFLLGKLIWRDVHLVNTISMSAFFLLLANPFQLFDLGFQLTFAATFSIILFFSRVMKFLPHLPLKISETFALSLTAQIGILPLIASSFNRVVFSSLILNLLAIPLVGLIMAAGYIFLPVSFTTPILAKPLAASIKFLIQIFMKSTHLLDGFHFLSYRIPTPHLFTVIGYFSFLLLLLWPWKTKKLKLLLFLGFGIFFFLLILYPFPSSSKNLKLTFLDVGQGDSILIEFPGDKKMLIDGGGLPTGTFDIGESVVSPFLWRKGIKKIDYVILTHSHPDHLNGLVAVAKNFKIGQFWENPSSVENENYKELKKSLSSKSQKRIDRGFNCRIGGVLIEALSPKKEAHDEFPLENDLSLVLRLTYGQTSFLLAGDIGVDAERDILETGAEIQSQVLKSAHHGSDSSSSELFLGRAAPQVIVISVGERNPYSLPSREVLERYRQTGARVLRTDIHGAVEVTSNGQRITTRSASDEKPSD